MIFYGHSTILYPPNLFYRDDCANTFIIYFYSDLFKIVYLALDIFNSNLRSPYIIKNSLIKYNFFKLQLHDIFNNNIFIKDQYKSKKINYENNNDSDYH